MMKSESLRRVLLISVLLGSGAGVPARGGAASPSPLPSPGGESQREFAARLAEGDRFFRERQVTGNLRKSLEVYKALLAIRPEDPELQWRYAMACYGVGVRATRDSTEKQRLFEEGARVGSKSVEKAPRCVPCLFWTAINRVLYANEVGAVKLLFAIPEIQGWARKVIELEPGYAQGGAHRLLGQIEQGVPGILGGSNRRAREHFESAIKAAPDEPMNHMALARLLYEELDEPEAAIAQARLGVAVPPLPKDRVEGNEAREELRALLRAWEQKQGVGEKQKPSDLPSAAPSVRTES
jgi:hypothetical protein